MALLHYIKCWCPGDRQQHNMITLCFSMCQEISENEEAAACIQLTLDWVLALKVSRGHSSTSSAVLLATHILSSKKGKSPWDWLFEAEVDISYSAEPQWGKSEMKRGLGRHLRFLGSVACASRVSSITNQCVCWCHVKLSWCFREKWRTRGATISYFRVCVYFWPSSLCYFLRFYLFIF